MKRRLEPRALDGTRPCGGVEKWWITSAHMGRGGRWGCGAAVGRQGGGQTGGGVEFARRCPRPAPQPLSRLSPPHAQRTHTRAPHTRLPSLPHPANRALGLGREAPVEARRVQHVAARDDDRPRVAAVATEADGAAHARHGVCVGGGVCEEVAQAELKKTAEVFFFRKFCFFLQETARALVSRGKSIPAAAELKRRRAPGGAPTPARNTRRGTHHHALGGAVFQPDAAAASISASSRLRSCERGGGKRGSGVSVSNLGEGALSPNTHTHRASFFTHQRGCAFKFALGFTFGPAVGRGWGWGEVSTKPRGKVPVSPSGTATAPALPRTRVPPQTHGLSHKHAHTHKLTPRQSTPPAAPSRPAQRARRPPGRQT